MHGLSAGCLSATEIAHLCVSNEGIQIPGCIEKRKKENKNKNACTLYGGIRTRGCVLG